MSRSQLLTDAQWSLIEDLLRSARVSGGRPFQDARSMAEGMFSGTVCGIVWRGVPEVFGPWQSI